MFEPMPIVGYEEQRRRLDAIVADFKDRFHGINHDWTEEYVAEQRDLAVKAIVALGFTAADADRWLRCKPSRG
ncbi:MAG: hypothetical protein KGL26_03090 [Pseudomonadota bacterium]|nr:hypothetical protein [Pseudomonadota bacterium]